MSYAFYAMMHRMRHITRWGLMRNVERENIKEHSQDVAVLAHALALIRRRCFGDGRICPRPEYCVLLAIFHDAAEIFTGDLPTPVKYFNRDIREAYEQVENHALEAMMAAVPEDFSEDYRALLRPDRGDAETDAAMKLVKAADTLAAYIKCMDERLAGNREFVDAEESLKAKLAAYDLPELDWFMEKALPAYAQSLDRLRITKLLQER